MDGGFLKRNSANIVCIIERKKIKKIQFDNLTIMLNNRLKC